MLEVTITSVVAIVFIAIVLERIAEYVVVETLNRIYALIMEAFGKEPEMAPKLRLLLISTVIFICYILFFWSVDVLSPIFAEYGITFEHWQVAILSGLLVAGGSNFVHTTLFNGSPPDK